MSKRKNDDMINAKKDKYSEYITQYVDIERELGHYHNEFRGKTIYCNTDDQNSNFFMYFAYLFEALELKRLIATKYVEGGHGIMTVYDGETVVDYDKRCVVPDSSKFKVSELEGDGDFRSLECKVIMDLCDVVVTNPPFSLFREFINLIMSKDKKFLIIGSASAILYKEVFPLIKEHKMWSGYKGRSVMTFQCPDDYEPDKDNSGYHVTKDGKKFRDIQACTWFTNLDVYKYHQDLDFRYEYKKDATHFPKYDNYDAINVDKVDEIPMDYPGVMGVPISFIDKWNPEQFELLGLSAKANCPQGLHADGHDYVPHINGEAKFDRLFIRFKPKKIDPFGWGIATPDRDWVANPITFDEMKVRWQSPKK